MRADRGDVGDELPRSGCGGSRHHHRRRRERRGEDCSNGPPHLMTRRDLDRHAQEGPPELRQAGRPDAAGKDFRPCGQQDLLGRREHSAIRFVVPKHYARVAEYCDGPMADAHPTGSARVGSMKSEQLARIATATPSTRQRSLRSWPGKRRNPRVQERQDPGLQGQVRPERGRATAVARRFRTAPR